MRWATAAVRPAAVVARRSGTHAGRLHETRTAVEALRTEAGLRRQIAERAPQQLVHEAAARDAALRLARPRAESASWPMLAPQAPAHGPGGCSR